MPSDPACPDVGEAGLRMAPSSGLRHDGLQPPHGLRLGLLRVRARPRGSSPHPQHISHSCRKTETHRVKSKFLGSRLALGFRQGR